MSDVNTRRIAWRRVVRHYTERNQNLAEASARSSGPVAVLTLGIWFGLLTSLLEVFVLLGWLQIDGSAMLGSLQMNRHFLWMIPLSHLATFLSIAIPTALFAKFQPKFAWPLGIFLPSVLAGFSLLSMIKGLYSIACFVLSLGLAYQLTSLILPRSDRFKTLVRRSLPIFVGIVAILGIGSFDRLVLEERRTLAALPPAKAEAPNVLLILLDTVRADRLSAYGYNRDTTPNLKKLAARGVIFNEARSPAPWTLPSHASIFTGRWPHELGLEDGRKLDQTFPTLAEYLAERGYATSGFVGNTYFCNSWFGLGRGFLHYEDYYEENVLISPEEAFRCTAIGRWVIRQLGTSYLVRPETVHHPKDASRIKRDFLRWVDKNPSRPFFTFLNYIDAHDPYQTPPGFDRNFGIKPTTQDDFLLIHGWHQKNKAKLSPRDLTMINDAYDDCLLALDEQVGQLLDDLESRGRLDNTLIILTSDHGEQFGDRKLFGHGHSLYRPEVHVPLIVVAPKNVPSGRVIPQPVTLRDIPATIVDHLGLGGEPSPFPGHSLARFWGPNPPAESEPSLCEVDATMKIAKTSVWPPSQRGPLASLISEGTVYIRDALGGEELYDIAKDHDERSNLIASEPHQAILDRSRSTFDRLIPPGRGHR